MNSFLSDLNSHPRDKYIQFDEGPHIYTVDGDSNYTSVTTLIHKHFEHFDADKIIDNMMKSKKWPSNQKYYGKTKQEIKQLWDDNRDQAAKLGTQLHYEIECFYNKITQNTDAVLFPLINGVEYSYFMQFYNDHIYLKPYRTEWIIYDKELKIAGSIDMVFKNEDGTLSIYDWKRCKEITKVNRFNQFSNCHILSHLPDTNYWHYCLQLNTYKFLLEKNYNVTIRDLYLVCLHPETKSKNYLKIKVADLQNEVSCLLTLWLSMLS